MGFRAWAWLWIIIGANAITIYLLQRIVSFDKISEFFLNGIGNLAGDHRPIVILAGAIVCKCILLAVMYKKRMFLRL
jgi:hypothetical protein